MEPPDPEPASDVWQCPLCGALLPPELRDTTCSDGHHVVAASTSVIPPRPPLTAADIDRDFRRAVRNATLGWLVAALLIIAAILVSVWRD